MTDLVIVLIAFVAAVIWAELEARHERQDDWGIRQFRKRQP